VPAAPVVGAEVLLEDELAPGAVLLAPGEVLLAPGEVLLAPGCVLLLLLLLLGY
jgi:hypothetical protein